MRHKNTYYRTLTESYREHAALHRHGWPSDALVQLWFAEVCSLTGGIYTTLKAGHPVPDKYAVWFARLLAGGDPRIERLNAPPADFERLEEARTVALTFLGRFGITTLTKDQADAILEHICYPRVQVDGGAKAFVDYLRHKVECIWSIIVKGEYPDWVRGCDDKHFPEIVRWMYTRVGHEVTPQGRLLAPSQAQVAGAAYIGLSQADYCERATAWTANNRWSVVRAWHPKAGAIGMSIALPVTDAAYEAIAAGGLTPYECGAKHLSRTSLNVVLEAMAENPPYVGCAATNPTESLRMASIYQIAALARTQRVKEKSRVRLITFAGTPENEERLRATGFVANGRFMRHADPARKLKVYELSIAVHQLVSRNVLEAAMLAHVGAHLPEEPPMDAG